VKLDRRILFQRATSRDDGFGQALEWHQHGTDVWAHKADVSDAERWRAGEVQAHITTRFTVRATAFTKNITPKDRLMFDGRTYDIFGVKEPAGTRNRWVEITASARSDT